VDVEESRGCFRVTGFSANIPPSVSLDELSDAGSIPPLSSLICLDSSKKSQKVNDVNNSASNDVEDEDDEEDNDDDDDKEDEEEEDDDDDDDDGKGEENDDDEEEEEDDDEDEERSSGDKESDSGASSLSSEGFLLSQKQLRRHSSPHQKKLGSKNAKTLLRATSHRETTLKGRCLLDPLVPTFRMNNDHPTPIARHVSTRFFPPSDTDSSTQKDSNVIDLESTVEAITQSAYDSENALKAQSNQQQLESKSPPHWFEGCGSWTFDPSSRCERYGLVLPIAIIKCAKKHTSELRKFRIARQAKSRVMFKDAVSNCLKRAEEARIQAARDKASEEAATLAEEEATYEVCAE
jgi:hypothetical protein